MDDDRPEYAYIAAVLQRDQQICASAAVISAALAAVAA
jgi:hypothetical protein